MAKRFKAEAAETLLDIRGKRLLLIDSNGQPRGKKRMPMAFVLINADLGAEEDLLKKLKSIQNVKDVYVVYGVYDIVARVEADTMDKVKETITWNIRRLDKVRSTLTMIVVEPSS
jgi:DNA-binding Lrp family transcriptional regulator